MHGETPWKCPYCGMLMKRSHEYDFLKDAGGLVGFGSGTIKCIGCGQEVPTLDVLNGKYDVLSGGAKGCFWVFILLVVFILVVLVVPLWLGP